MTTYLTALVTFVVLGILVSLIYVGVGVVVKLRSISSWTGN